MPSHYIRTDAQPEALKKAGEKGRAIIKSREHFVWLTNAIACHRSDECLIWPFAISTTTGYGKCQYNGKTVSPHRLAFFITNGHWPTPQARHTCDVRACLNPKHIIEGTAKQNCADMVERGRKPRGEQHCHRKLTDAIVTRIRADYGEFTRQQLADRYGVHESNIGHIIHGRSWKHLL